MSQYDCVIVGGGLAGCLLFYALKVNNSDAKVLLLEKNSALAGNHTWSFHEADISWSQNNWIRSLISKSWNEYEVIFPQYRRVLKSPYHSIKSFELHRFIMSRYSDFIRLNEVITSMDKNNVKLASGETIHSSCVVDARGWGDVKSAVGHQKFVGLDVRLRNPHQLTGVRLKDATVKQIDGYRFVYVLPWSEKEILVEDTYYSNSSQLNLSEVKENIFEYLQKEGLEVETILREESGCLPLVEQLSEVPDEGPVVLGARSGIYHPVTGYTFPQTFKRVEHLVSLKSFDTEIWKKSLNQLKSMERRQRSYSHFLNKLLFKAAPPLKRYRVLEHFYRLPQGLIERFYRGELTRKDQLMVFLGKPPVSLVAFFKVLFK